MKGMKKILISLSIIGIVAAIVIGATVAYFNDTETSVGNILVAGTLDLKVDHIWQTYNDAECKTCSVEIKSDTSNTVTGTNGGADPFPFPHPAVQVNKPHPAWTVTSDIPGATWIWATDPTLEADTTHDVYYTFQKTFEWWGPVTGATLYLGVGTDNGYQVKLNGDIVGTDWTEYNYKSPADTYSGFGSYIIQGTNTLEIEVKNKGMLGGTPAKNPAGLLYKLTINGNCGDNYFKTHCKLWGLKDLGPGDYFWNLDDIKPDYHGTNVISLHAYDNDAWVCLIIHDKEDSENTWTEPEQSAGDTTGGVLEGELSQYLEVGLWLDANQNNQYDAGETVLYEGSLANGPIRMRVFDSTNGLKLVASNTYYIGLAWCFGDQTINQGTGIITCDGSGNNDKAQTDSMVAKITAYAEQWRNNPNFQCANVTLP